MSRTRLLLSVVAIVSVVAGWPHAQQLQKVTINYPTRSGASWPLYLARDGGYYAKQGLEVDLQFGVHPAGVAMLTSGQAGHGQSLARAGDGGEHS
jgi:ABC-type nitrate/sulfonate/bicarbonate transport system substrate-binding protein